MPAASYREGPDGHSSRKQNSKRRRAKCSPSFVSGRVIGHGDISPRCIPECSAMARCTAPYPLLAPAAPALCLSCFWRGRSPSPAFGAVFFAGRAAVIWCGTNPGVRPWQDLRECALGRLAVAIFSRGAFPGGNPWQFFRLMHLRGGFGRENRQFAARFARHASENGLALAGYARHASEMPRKSPSEDTPREDLARKGPFSLHGPLESCTARRSCHPAWRQTARAPATPVPPNSVSRQS